PPLPSSRLRGRHVLSRHRTPTGPVGRHGLRPGTVARRAGGGRGPGGDHPVSSGRRRTVPSLLALASTEPSGLNATDHTRSVCPSRISRSVPSGVFHRRTVPSSLALASSEPSGLNATDRTQSACPS